MRRNCADEEREEKKNHRAAAGTDGDFVYFDGVISEVSYGYGDTYKEETK